jgi:hypothetical protein
VALPPILWTEVLRLYPGIHTPALPLYPNRDIFDALVPLKNATTPSDLPPDDNANIITLHLSGSRYLDGLASTYSTARSNVEVLSFTWADVFSDVDNHPAEEGPSGIDLLYYPPPTTVGKHGSQRYLDTPIGELVHCAGPNAGAVFVASADLAAGDEILLDYGLQYPLPSWAFEWYEETA